MSESPLSRRNFLGSSALITVAKLSGADGIKLSDLPDLTIKEVKAHITGEDGLACVVTSGGIEGNYTLRSRYWHPDWNNTHWVDYAKQVLVGKSALDRPAFTSQWDSPRRRRGQSSYASAIDNCLWDILGKAVGLPVYRLLGTHKTRALAVGRVLDQLHYVAFEDPIPTSDIDGLAELARALDVPIRIGEFLFSMYDYAEYIRQGAVEVVRFVVDHVGGITGGMKIANLAECSGLECTPHNWGDTLEQAVHFHCELAMPNSTFFEMTIPQSYYDPPYLKDRIQVAPDGYVYAPTKPGLGYEINRDVLDNMTKRIER
jgi:L-alanine-DL-glutamate epimerase-like enolase superfamily enzyme